MVDVSPRVNQAKKAIFGLSVSRASDSTLEISEGRCKDSSNKMDLGVGSSFPEWTGGSVSAPLTIDVSVVGANGIDAGTLGASKVYAIYLIGDTSGANSIAGLCSLASNSLPTMPFGYDAYRLIGYALTDASSDFLEMYQTGNGHSRKLLLDAIVATSVTAGDSTTYADIDLATLVPPVENALVYVQGKIDPATAGNALSLQKKGAIGAQGEVIGQVNGVEASDFLWIPNGLDSSVSTISYKVANASDAAAVNVVGFAYEV